MNIIFDIWKILLSPPIFVPLIFPGFLTAMAVLVVLIWFERKLTARVQMRYGPLYVLKPLAGIIQMIADLFKFTFTEFIVPKGSDKRVFILSPILFFAVSLVPLVAIPLSTGFAAVYSELSVLMVLALLTLAPIFVLILGWASDNKFSFIGSLREGYMILGYEIPMFVSILAMAILYDSLNLINVVESQSVLWGVILNPLAAITFFGAILMTTSRFPFDISEAESEIVIGPYTEYSGLFFVLCLGAPYVKLYVLSLFYAEVFLGGWNPLIWPLNANPILPGIAVLVKALVVMGLCVLMRSIYPRYRIDQALRLGWHKLLVLSLISIVLSIVLVGIGVV
jgi:NADH:ubiquinone oxidoreductase subunit H